MKSNHKPSKMIARRRVAAVYNAQARTNPDGANNDMARSVAVVSCLRSIPNYRAALCAVGSSKHISFVECE
jgi:hypothetical protein